MFGRWSPGRRPDGRNNRGTVRVGLRSLLAAALAVGVTAAVMLPAEPALAVCTGSRCNSLDPSRHCTATSTPEEEFIGGEITLQLRYSSGCRAYWGRAIADNCGDHPWPMYIRVQRQIYTPYGYATSHVYYSGQVSCAGSPQWTPMVGDYESDRQRSCFGFSSDGRRPAAMPESWWTWCTAWHPPSANG